MVRPKTFYIFARGIKILLLLLLIGVECMLNLSGDNAAFINQTALQLTRSQILVNSVYTLAYRPVAEQGQALHDLQITLPPFEQEQTHLLTNTAVDVQILLQQARTDYLPLIAALQFILVHPHSVVNPLEVNIIVLHERSYLVTMNALLLTLPRHSQDRAIQLFVIQIVIEVLFIIVFVIVMTTFVWEVYTYKNDKVCSSPAMNGIVLALQSQIEQKIAVDFYAEIAIEGALLIFFTVLLLFGYDPFVSPEQRKARGLVV